VNNKSVLYVVKSTVAKEHEEDFNRWYHKKHIPELVEASGCISARRFKVMDAGDQFTYMAVYEYKDKETFMKYQGSEKRKELISDYLENYDDVSELQFSSWEQIFP